MKFENCRFSLVELQQEQKFLLDKIESKKSEIRYLESIFQERGYKDIVKDESDLLGKSYSELAHYNFLLALLKSQEKDLLMSSFKFERIKREENHQEKLLT